MRRRTDWCFQFFSKSFSGFRKKSGVLQTSGFLQTSLIENSNNKTSFQNEIAASKKREIVLQAEAKDLRDQVSELITRLEGYTKTNSEQLTSISLENQETKAEVNRTQIKFKEAQNTITNLQTALADSNHETTTINTHYKQQLLHKEFLKTSNTNLEQEISKEKDEHLYLQNKHKKLKNLYDTVIAIASSSNKNEFAESNKKLLNDIERITSETIKYESTKQTLKQLCSSFQTLSLVERDIFQISFKYLHIFLLSFFCRHLTDIF